MRVYICYTDSGLSNRLAASGGGAAGPGGGVKQAVSCRHISATHLTNMGFCWLLCLSVCKKRIFQLELFGNHDVQYRMLSIVTAYCTNNCNKQEKSPLAKVNQPLKKEKGCTVLILEREYPWEEQTIQNV